MKQLYEPIAFSPVARLTQSIGAGDVVIQVDNVAAFPDAPSLATIGVDDTAETILYAAKTENSLSGCTRGVEGEAKTWNEGESIGRNFTAKDHADIIANLQEVADHAANTENPHRVTATQVGAVPATTGAQGQFLGFTARNTIGAVDAPKGKRTARFIVGTSTAGWTAADCDYLCDGTDDQVEINAAIQALPAEGGEVVILDGTYNIAASIEINKPNTKMSGSRASTILKAAAASIRVINITKDYCSVDSLTCDGVKESFAGTYGIYSNGNYVSIINNICCNNEKAGIYNYGKRNTAGNDSIIHKNICINNGSGINNDGGDRIIISENTCSKNSNNGIQNSGANNKVNGNTCTENYSGIYSTSTCIIIGNICEGNSNQGIQCAGGSIIGNHCYSNHYDGFLAVREIGGIP